MSDEKKNPENENHHDTHEKKDGVIKLSVEVPAWVYPDGNLTVYVGTGNPPVPPGGGSDDDD